MANLVITSFRGNSLGSWLWALSALVFGGCGESVSAQNGDSPHAPTQNSLAPEKLPLVYFVASNYRDSSILYSFDVESKKGAPVLVRGAESADMIAFQDETTGALYAVERFADATPTRVTLVRGQKPKPILDISGLPENVHALARNEDAIVALGWNKGDLAWITTTLSKTWGHFGVVNPNTAPENLSAHQPNHLEAFFARNGKTYVLSSGLDAAYRPAPALLHEVRDLNAGLVPTSSTEGEGYYPLARSTEVPDCQNAFAVAQRRTHEAILSCNPQWGVPDAEGRVTLVQVAFGPEGNPSFRTLVNHPATEVNTVRAHGYSPSGRFVFVTESLENPTRTTSRYWLDLHLGTKIPISRYGHASFGLGFGHDLKTNTMVFGCAVETHSGRCLPNTFALVREESLGEENQAEFVHVDYVNPGLTFAAPLPYED